LISGSETWGLTERNKKRTDTVEIDALRRSIRISRMDERWDEEMRIKM
jgi:hypothetical protein